MTRQRLAPLTGVGVVVAAVVGFTLVGATPDTSDTASEIVAYYADNGTRLRIASMVFLAAGVLTVFFGAYLRSALRDPETPDDMLATTVLAGATIFGTAVAIDATLLITLTESADDLDPASVTALQAVWEYDFIPFVLGAQVVLIAAGVLIASRARLPRWLGWVALLLAALGFTPLGSVCFVGVVVWIGIVSALLALRVGPTAAPDRATQRVGT